jgi:hypothetical protein
MGGLVFVFADYGGLVGKFRLVSFGRVELGERAPGTAKGPFICWGAGLLGLWL